MAFAPSSGGFGYAVLDGGDALVLWGCTHAKGDKNSQAIKKAEKMIQLYAPDVVVLEDSSAKGSQRRDRIRMLTKDLATVARKLGVKVVLLPRTAVRKSFFGEAKGTKHAVAKIVAERFPEELEHRLPPERKLWTSEAKRMALFEAVALALALYAMFKAKNAA